MRVLVPVHLDDGEQGGVGPAAGWGGQMAGFGAMRLT